jgi:hypothetical protein
MPAGKQPTSSRHPRTKLQFLYQEGLAKKVRLWQPTSVLMPAAFAWLLNARQKPVDATLQHLAENPVHA